MKNDPLVKFVDAQEDVFKQALAELKSGKKRSHWMWFVFPQLAGLGHSMRASYYGITDINQAREYLQHAVLGDRLRQCLRALQSHNEKSAWEIFGSPDNWKLKSCLTLFELAATSEDDRSLFQSALSQFFEDERDQKTLSMLGASKDKASAGGPQKIGAIKNPTDAEIIALIRSSKERAARRIVCEASGDVWCWPAENALHAEGAEIIGASYSKPPGGEILTLD